MARRRNRIHIYKKHRGVWRRYRSNPFRHNIKMGFYDATGFHPVRASSDYDPDRVDELYRYGRRGKEKIHHKVRRRRKKRTTHARSRRRTTRTRRTHRRRRSRR